MKFIGLDLAWGERAWTGLAVLDARGQLVSMDRARTDLDIAHGLQPHLKGPVLVAVDAPLVVKNQTGRRPCEAQVSGLFGRFHAGPHSSNLSLPVFREGSRGGRVVDMLGLGLDPAFDVKEPVRRAIEVYPHPATVTLFGLATVVPYKAKPGRSPEDRRLAMLRLMEHIESLVTATPSLDVGSCPDWGSALQSISGASTHAELNRWEDAVDAVLCAYIGMHRWWHGDAESAVLGDLDSGYIVVPLDERVRRALADGPVPNELIAAAVEELSSP